MTAMSTSPSATKERPMTDSKRYRSVETDDTIGFYTLAFGSRHGAYSIKVIGDGALRVNGERYILVNGPTQAEE